MPSCEKYEVHIMALLAGSLDETGQRRLDEHLQQCPACRSECEALQGLAEDIELMGHAIVADLPPVDLAGAVMDAIGQTDARPAIIPFVPRPRRRVRWAWAGLAAAAALAIMIGLVRTKEVSEDVVDQRTQVVSTPPVTAQPVPAVSEEEGLRTPVSPALQQPATQKIAEEFTKLTKRTLPRMRPSSRNVDIPDLAAITVRDVFDDRVDTLTKEDALDRINQWATLSAERARQIANTAGVSPGAVVGASASLPPDEAAGLLETLIEELGDDPYVHLARAEALSADPVNHQAAEAEIAQVAMLDPDNALPSYLQARNAFSLNDVPGGLRALSEAQDKQTVRTYAIRAADYHGQVLTEAGMLGGTANMIAALTAGTDEYDFLVSLGEELLQYGQFFELENQLEIAQEIYEAVYFLGEQILGGAEFSSESVAGLDIQRLALGLLEETYAAIGAVTGMEWLADEVEQMIAPIEGLLDVVESLNAVFLGPFDETELNDLANALLEYGDLNLELLGF